MFKKLFSYGKYHWLTQDDIRNAIRNGAEATLKKSSKKFCLSSDNKYAILIREHAAWNVSDDETQKWRDGNYPPKDGAIGRDIISVFKMASSENSGYFFKLFVPIGSHIMSLHICSDDQSKFTIEIDNRTLAIPFLQLDNFRWKALTGHAQAEDDIIEKFNQFIDL